MRHRIGHRKFGRNCGHRTSMFRNLLKSLIIHEKIVTTVAKAKDVRPMVEKLVTKSRMESLHTRRYAISLLGGNCTAVNKLFTLGVKYNSRSGGYTRIVKIGYRKGDSAPLAAISFV
ncbi:50S ribosomal protein L17 [Candidatus Fokinia crypta]|uniref:50S ribosomal protein L17 n=1 Tax=Candidatus Fokinia crypta TaxID=1920990 RepID=A0ABZ0UNH2_9RICK|nr:50S ribosomal protein L17 [Candidatus Fokinia cryptica]WPX97673.1 50S ribosomal protein L17 [Candidatus Fokinia cryptica]